MDLTSGPGEDQKRSDNERCQAAATADCEHVYATRIRGGEPICIPSCMLCGELGWDDIREQAEKIRAEAYRAGREDAARDIAQAIESAAAADRTPQLVGHDAVLLWDGRQFAYDHSAALARAARVRDCGDEFHGADGGPCQGCGFDVADQVDQPRTPSGCDGEDSPEERTDEAG